MSTDPSRVPQLPVRERNHWVLVRACRVGDHVDRFLHAGAGAFGRWVDARSSSWIDRGRSTLVVVDGEAPTSLHESHGDVAVVRGQIRWYGQPWQDPAGWAARLLERWPARPYGKPLEGTVGDATVACVDCDGLGVLGADEFGSSNAYYHLSDDLLVAGSSPALIADVLRMVGRPASPDVVGMAWMARAGFQVTDSTPYLGIARLPVGSRLVLRRDGRVQVVEPSVLWADHGGWEQLGVEEVLDVVQASVADHLRAAVGVGQRVVLDITGGKDSRLVLAVATSVLDADDYVLRTVGPPSAPDVRIASDIASRLGLEHQTGFPRARTPGTFDDHTEAFLDTTGGMYSIWVGSVPHPWEPEVRVSGTSGELLRVASHEAPIVDGGPERWHPTPNEVADVFDRFCSRGLTDDLVTPDAREMLRERLVRHLEHLLEIGTPSDQLAYRFFAGFHNRVVTGELLDLEADHRVMPLVDVRGVRALNSLPQPVRHSEPVHRGLIARLAPTLLDVPLANGTWRAEGPPRPGQPTRPVGPTPVPTPPRLSSTASAAAPTPAATAPQPAASGPPAAAPVPRPTNAPPPGSIVPAAGDPAPAAWSVMAIAKSAPNEERERYLAAALADAPADVWKVVDRSKVDGTLEALGDAPMKVRKQLYAAATIARWLARMQARDELGEAR